VPDWLPNPLGKYYLYFAHHVGQQIRLAYSDNVEGPYTVHAPKESEPDDKGNDVYKGVLYLKDTIKFIGHIASPDVHVDHEEKKLHMIFHGYKGNQPSNHAVSSDGLTFVDTNSVLNQPYLRVFKYGNEWWGVTRGTQGTERSGYLYKSKTGEIDGYYQKIRDLIIPDFGKHKLRHSAVQLEGHTLVMYYSTQGNAPERIRMVSFTMDQSLWDDSGSLTTTIQAEVAQSQFDYEGANYKISYSKPATAINVHQLRDPYFFIDPDSSNKYLVYSGAGETNMCIARLFAQGEE